MKYSSNSFTGKFILITALISTLLAGCATPTPTMAPTVDPATYVAAAVSTLRAQMTEDALRNPSATPMPTNTPVPPTETPIPPTETPSLPTLTPTLAATVAPPLSAKFLTASTFPGNKYEYVPNEKFGLAIRFKNTGTIAWDTTYSLRMTGWNGPTGDYVTVQTELGLGKAILPGESAEFDLWAFGSETLGVHTYYFQLYTGSGGAVPGGSAVFSYKSK